MRGVVADLDRGNARELLRVTTVILDASDNFETRLLVSDAARALGRRLDLRRVRRGGGPRRRVAPGRRPACAAISRPCRRPAPVRRATRPGSSRRFRPTVAGIAMTEALRTLADGASRPEACSRSRSWSGGYGRRDGSSKTRARRPACPVCAGNRYPGARRGGRVGGRQALRTQSRCRWLPAARERPDLDALERRLARVGDVRRSEHLLSAEVEGREPDGLFRRPLRRSRHGGSRCAPGRCTSATSGDDLAEAACVDSRPETTRMRRIPIDDLIASPEEIAQLRELLGARGRRGAADGDLLRAGAPIRSSEAGVQPDLLDEGTGRRQGAPGSVRNARAARPAGRRGSDGDARAVHAHLARAADRRASTSRADRGLARCLEPRGASPGRAPGPGASRRSPVP